MRVPCVYDEQSDDYSFFDATKGTQLVKRLQDADEVVSFNGKQFDLLVLRRHFGLRGRLPKRGKHVDIYEIMTTQADFRVSLDSAVKENLKENKHTSGKSMKDLDFEKLKDACRSDVEQTYRLWNLHARCVTSPNAGAMSSLVPILGHKVSELRCDTLTLQEAISLHRPASLEPDHLVKEAAEMGGI